jgi:hypothetical protein
MCAIRTMAESSVLGLLRPSLPYPPKSTRPMPVIGSVHSSHNSWNYARSKGTVTTQRRNAAKESGLRHERVLSVRRDQKRDAFDKPARRLNRVLGALRRHMRTGAGLIVGNRFQVLGARKKSRSAMSNRGSSFTLETAVASPHKLYNPLNSICFPTRNSNAEQLTAVQQFQ